MDQVSQSELVAFLNELLEAERAGSRVTARTARDIDDDDLKRLIADIQRDEAKWCGVLVKALKTLDGAPSTQVGAFYDKAMAIDDLSARLAFLNRGQGWVARKLRDMLPRIGDAGIQGDLAEMLAAHERNIALVEKRTAAS